MKTHSGRIEAKEISVSMEVGVNLGSLAVGDNSISMTVGPNSVSMATGLSRMEENYYGGKFKKPHIIGVS